MSETSPRYNAIEPALSAEEWGRTAKAPTEDGTTKIGIRVDPDPPVYPAALSVDAFNGEHWDEITIPSPMLGATIALANHALPDDDPRKITRADVMALHVAINSAVQDEDRLERLAAALESYLPPEP